MNANLSPIGRRRARAFTTAAIGHLFALTSPLHAGTPAELLVNGDFGQILTFWSVDDSLGDWIPYEHPAGTVSLHPGAIFGYTGTVICQPLNIDGIAEKEVGVSIDLGCDWAPPPGNTVGVYLEYLDGAGIRHRDLVLSPDNSLIPEGSLTSFGGTFTFPADASRLVEIAIDKLGDGSVRCDNLSLTSTELTPGPVPRLGSVDPSAVGYGGSVVIRGSNFGAAQGQVLVGGTTAGVTVESWSPDEITVRIDGACTGGMVRVDANGPLTCERRELSITSPHFTLETHAVTGGSFGPGGAGPVIATPGQPVQVDVRTAFQSGFTTGTGIQLACTEAPGAATFSPNPVLGDGGSLLTFDTTGLVPGIHTFTVTGTETTSPVRSDTFQVDVRGIQQVNLTYDGGTPVDGATFTSQAPVALTTRIDDSLGNEITYDIPAPVWSSSNPGVIDVFRGSTPWADHLLLPHSTGNATIRATLPDGSQHDFSVSVSVPDEPMVTGHTCNNMSNDPAEMNWHWFATSGAMSSFGSSIGDLPIVWGDSGYVSANTYHYQEFTVGSETSPAKPGSYLFRASATIGLSGGGSASVSSGCVFQVFNDPAYGMVTGHVAQFGGSMMGHGANGTLEFHDASTGTLAFTRELWEWTFDYNVPRVPPGTYKLRLDASMGDPSAPGPRWYPNAASFADAGPVTVTAGATAGDVNFTLFTSADPLPPPPIVGAPTHDPGAGTFGFTIRTTNGRTYDLQKSTTLLDGSWFTIQSIWGDGTDVPLFDSQATDDSGFYRVVPR